jgi:uncharacterized protein (TIGR02646 family)
MRFIDNRFLNKPDDDWDRRAISAKEDVINNGGDVNSYRDVWADCKDILAEKSHDKCWYCEIKQERSDDAVDHFRPKSLYKWLAFGINNFRYACTYCNSLRRDKKTGLTGGKGNYFPLFNDDQRATIEGQENHEQPHLLDPCCSHDPSLLDFLGETGKATPRDPDHERRKIRAETSIKLYHLNHDDLVEKRKRLAIDLIEKINIANELYDRVDTGDNSLDKSYNKHVCDLKNAMAEEAELSSFAKKIIMGQRNILWVESLIQTI